MKVDYRETILAIQTGKIAPVYFLNGDDFFLQDFFIGKVEQNLNQGKKSDKTVLIPEVMDFTRILAEITSASLFAESKLYILRNPLRIKGNNRKELLSYCMSPIKENCLIIIIDKYDAKSALIRDLNRLIGSINTSPPFPNKMAGWVKFLLKENNLSAEQEAVDRLIELSGDSIYHISNEIEKIKIDLGDKDTLITEKLVQKHAGWERSYFPWHLLDAVGQKDYKKAVYIGRILLQQGTDISTMLSLLTSMFQELYFLYIVDNSSQSKMQTGWISTQVKKKLPIYRKQYRKRDIQLIFRNLAKADMRVKSSAVNSKAILVPLLYQIIKSRD